MNTQKDSWEEGASIIIPTYKRPESLEIALRSVMNSPLADRPLEIIVADNDPAGSAKKRVFDLMAKAEAEMRYIHVPDPGVSNARNGAMDAARGRYIAFLDDDMEALEGWLEQLIRVSQHYSAGLCFGPITAQMPHPEDPLNRHMQAFFSRLSDDDEGLISDPYGTGGSLIDLKLCRMPHPVFNPDLNQTGGEDDFLFQHLIATGTSIAWAPKAMSYEHVPPSRVTESYLWKRNFAFGQGPTQGAADKGLKGSFEIAKWMAVGCVQTLIYAPLYKTLQVMNKPSYAKYLAKTAQGVGKVLWWGDFSPRLYGQTAP